MSLWLKLREVFFGSASVRGVTGKAAATTLIDQIVHGGLKSLPDEQLMALVGLLVTTPGMRTPLRGSVRFMDSVMRQWQKKRAISARQRQGILNILEKAYPHNLAAELRNL